ncbi:MAG: class I SAM-dependent methyltransferase [Candidatus Latescibacterota bacterium]|nr:MAG: class I SAM-dependent methyltransferase [Candidatus Latescibacterota bacterium]
MEAEFQIEDLGEFRRVHTKGPHTHDSAKGARTCEACAVDLPFSSKFIRQLLDWDSRGFFHFIGERLCNDTFNEEPKKLVERFCPRLSGCKVLDFGSGLGQLSPFFFERGASEVLLAEIDNKLLKLSRTYLEDMGYTEKCRFIHVKENDELSMIDNGSLDLIVASEVFEHILPRYRRQALQTLYAKLKPGGIIVITTPNRLFPKDTHTTGLWFAAWLPTGLGAWYARTFASWRWKDRSTEDLLRQGLRQYSYFEARDVLKPLGAQDLCSEYPQKHEKGNSVKSRVFYKTLSILFALILKRFGPWEAWRPSLAVAWSKPGSRPSQG